MKSDVDTAEMIARFRTPPGFSWEPLRDDLVTAFRVLRSSERDACAALAEAHASHHMDHGAATDASIVNAVAEAIRARASN